MARMEIDGMDDITGQLTKLQGNGIRTAVKRIVMAGAEADAREMEKLTRQAGHIRTGSMVGNIRAGTYHESLDGGEVNVYPQGNDARGTSNAMKAFVINYGRGKRKSKKMGDKYITGAFATTEKIVGTAMAEEAEKVFREMGVTT